MFSNYTVGTVVSQHDHCDHKHTCVTPGFAQTDDYGNIVRFQWTPDARFNFEVTSDSWIPVPEGSISLTQSGQLPDDIATVCDTFAYNTVDYRCWKNDCGTWLEQPEISIDPQSRTRLLFSDKSKSTRVVIKNFREEVVQTFESSGNTVSIVVDDTLAEQLLQGYYNMDVYLVGTSMIRHIRRIVVSIGNYVDDSVQCNPDCHEPVPVIPNPSLENEQKDAWELNRAFISVNSIEERDSLNIDSLPHGKIVRVADTTDGVKYYSWDQVTFTWKEETFPVDSSTKVKIEVDDHLSETSTNPVQNKVIYEALRDINNTPTVVADWNQSDPSQPDYIKNRTHWQNRQLVYDGLSTFGGSGMGWIGYPYYLQIPTTSLNENFAGVLVVDGVSYEFDSGSWDGDGVVHNTVNVGSTSIFVICTVGGPPNNPYYHFVIYSSDDLSGSTIQLYVDETHKLDEKFIPSSIARLSQIPTPFPQLPADWCQVDENSLDYVKNRTHGLFVDECEIYQITNPSGNDFEYVGVGLGYKITTTVNCEDPNYLLEWGAYAIHLHDGWSGCGGISLCKEGEESTDHPNWVDNHVGLLMTVSDPILHDDKYYYNVTTYFRNIVPENVKYIDLRLTMPQAKPLDDKYIPDTVVRWTDLSSVVLTDDEVSELLNKLNRYSGEE